MTTVLDRPAQIDSQLYRRQGFVLIKELFRSEEIERIRAEAKEIFTKQMQRHNLVSSARPTEREFEEGMYRLFAANLQTFANCGKQAQHLISLHRLSLDARITDRLRDLGLAFPNISTRPVLYFNSERLAKKEVYWRLSAHQDWRSMQGSLDSVVVWLPLIDLNRDLGALEVVPGSHTQGLLDADLKDGYGQMRDQVDEAGFVPVEVERGDALFFSTFLVHRSGTNITESIRWSCHFRYNNLHETTFIERGYPHPYLYRPQEELITPDFPDAAQVAKTFAART
jgi:phytanoyl-CoA hydroxylase